MPLSKLPNLNEKEVIWDRLQHGVTIKTAKNGYRIGDELIAIGRGLGKSLLVNSVYGSSQGNTASYAVQNILLKKTTLQ